MKERDHAADQARCPLKRGSTPTPPLFWEVHATKELAVFELMMQVELATTVRKTISINMTKLKIALINKTRNVY
jgi:hypothetical protein